MVPNTLSSVIFPIVSLEALDIELVRFRVCVLPRHEEVIVLPLHSAGLFLLLTIAFSRRNIAWLRLFIRRLFNCFRFQNVDVFVELLKVLLLHFLNLCFGWFGASIFIFHVFVEVAHLQLTHQSVQSAAHHVVHRTAIARCAHIVLSFLKLKVGYRLFVLIILPWGAQWRLDIQL